MNQQTMKFGAILALVAIVSFSIWPFWKWLSVTGVNPEVRARTSALIEKHPQLKPAWNIAMQDGELTEFEAKEIIEGAGEKLDPQQ